MIVVFVQRRHVEWVFFLKTLLKALTHVAHDEAGYCNHRRTVLHISPMHHSQGCDDDIGIDTSIVC